MNLNNQWDYKKVHKFTGSQIYWSEWMLSPFTPRGKQYYPHAVGVQTRGQENARWCLASDLWCTKNPPGKRFHSVYWTQSTGTHWSNSYVLEVCSLQRKAALLGVCLQSAGPTCPKERSKGRGYTSAKKGLNNCALLHTKECFFYQ